MQDIALARMSYGGASVYSRVCHKQTVLFFVPRVSSSIYQGSNKTAAFLKIVLNLKKRVLLAFECLTESLMEEEYDYIKKELFLDDPLAQKAAQKLIDDWKKQLSGDKQLLADEVHDKYVKMFSSSLSSSPSEL